MRNVWIITFYVLRIKSVRFAHQIPPPVPPVGGSHIRLMVHFVHRRLRLTVRFAHQRLRPP